MTTHTERRVDFEST